MRQPNILLVIAGLLLVAACPFAPSLDDVSLKIIDDSEAAITPLPNISANFSVIPLGAFPAFDVNGTEIRVKPLPGTYGEFDAVLVAYDATHCFSVAGFHVVVYARPQIASMIPVQKSVELVEGRQLNFSVIVADQDNATLAYAWFVDGKKKGAETIFSYAPGFQDAGMHNISVIVTDRENLTVSAWWRADVKNYNRAPVLVDELPQVKVFVDSETAVFRLSRYFRDPDGEPLSFSVIYEDQEGAQVSSSFFAVQVDAQSKVTLRTSAWTGSFQVTFKATDPQNASARSNTVITSVSGTESDAALADDISKQSLVCGDAICGGTESCETCEQDCGICGGGYQGCQPRWNCSAWSACVLGQTQTRACLDMNECAFLSETPETSRICSLPSSCFDEQKNQGEEGIDCGGPCDSCFTCFDGKLNQGELGIDCGGPCSTCPACDDGFKSGFESDVDCGGPCEPCKAGLQCDVNTDCTSAVCVDLLCSEASCVDGTRNQRETGIDCGGPCMQECPTCSDEIMNGGELGIDCGGLCPRCPTCHDGIKNQSELLVDCGGQCGSCTLQDYGYLRVVLLGGGALVVLMVILVSRRSSRSVRAMGLLHQVLPVHARRNPEAQAKVKTTIDKLTAMENDPGMLKSREPFDEFYLVMDSFMASLSGVNMHDDGFEAALHKLPYSWAFRRVLLLYRERLVALRAARSIIVSTEVQGYVREALQVLDGLLHEA